MGERSHWRSLGILLAVSGVQDPLHHELPRGQITPADMCPGAFPNLQPALTPAGCPDICSQCSIENWPDLPLQILHEHLSLETIPDQ